MDLKRLKKIFENSGCKEIYVKKLAPNDNSKNQVYFGGSFEILNILPLSNIINEEAGDWKRERFKANLNFFWLSEDGIFYSAPNAQLILYPKYPEVRFSGFLLGCEKAPSDLMTQRLENRLLFISVAANGHILGYVTSPDSKTAKEFENEKPLHEYGVFSIIELPQSVNNKFILLNELQRIHNLGWIESKRLVSDGSIIPCSAPNCGGYTLEAELGITPNGYAEPDFMGWEVKQFGVSKFKNYESSRITLMTPEPNGGTYVEKGVEFFIKKYGYPDKMGRKDRMNFGGIHRSNERHKTTNLEMRVIGFDSEKRKIRNSGGRISLIDEKENEAASWSFSSMLLHWNKKHNKACYIPSINKKNQLKKYKFGNKIIIGTGTDFHLFLTQVTEGNIYYDPGIKMENISTNPKIKRRSQFRIKSGFLPHLYFKNEIIDLKRLSSNK